MKKVDETKFVKCAKKDEVPEILNTFHDLSGHDGINSTFRSIANEFYWKGMSTEIKEYVSEIYIYYSRPVYSNISLQQNDKLEKPCVRINRFYSTSYLTNLSAPFVLQYPVCLQCIYTTFVYY